MNTVLLVVYLIASPFMVAGVAWLCVQHVHQSRRLRELKRKN